MNTRCPSTWRIRSAIEPLDRVQHHSARLEDANLEECGIAKVGFQIVKHT